MHSNMNTFVPTSDPNFTSQEDWNTELETSTQVPKTLADQVANTKVGLAMQEHAGKVRDQVDETTQRNFERSESSEQQAVASYFERGELGFDIDGRFTINPETNKATLATIKESLLDIPLSPENRQEMVKLIAKVDEAIKNHEIQEAPQTVVRALKEMKELQDEVRLAVNNRQFDVLPYINVKLIEQALELLDGFEKMRASNPDKMIELVDELQSSEGPVNPYKTALINFVGTHNSFGFSEELENGLTYRAERDASY